MKLFEIRGTSSDMEMKYGNFHPATEIAACVLYIETNLGRIGPRPASHDPVRRQPRDLSTMLGTILLLDNKIIKAKKRMVL